MHLPILHMFPVNSGSGSLGMETDYDIQSSDRLLAVWLHRVDATNASAESPMAVNSALQSEDGGSDEISLDSGSWTEVLVVSTFMLFDFAGVICVHLNLLLFATQPTALGTTFLHLPLSLCPMCTHTASRFHPWSTVTLASFLFQGVRLRATVRRVLVPVHSWCSDWRFCDSDSCPCTLQRSLSATRQATEANTNCGSPLTTG
eukprot:SAG31_NODE_544_length_14245_cov_68.376644_4_plen_203_part_00